MADYFRFTAHNTYVKDKLTTAEISAVTRWQNEEYDFSFHTMHEAGWPLYIVEIGKRGQRSRPKINLKGTTAAEAEILEGIFDNNKVGVDAKEVAMANWTAFQKMAQMFYEGVTTTARPAKQVNVLEYTCKSPQCAGRTITQEYEGPVSIGNTRPPMAIRGLGVCKRCRQLNWEYRGSRALKAGEKPDIPLSQTTLPQSV